MATKIDSVNLIFWTDFITPEAWTMIMQQNNSIQSNSKALLQLGGGEKGVTIYSNIITLQ